MFCGVLCVAVIDKRAPVVCCCVAAKATVCGEPGIVERLLWKDSPQQPHWAPQTHAAGLNWLRLPIRLSTMLFRKQRRCCISFVIHIHSYIYIYIAIGYHKWKETHNGCTITIVRRIKATDDERAVCALCLSTDLLHLLWYRWYGPHPHPPWCLFSTASHGRWCICIDIAIGLQHKLWDWAWSQMNDALFVTHKTNQIAQWAAVHCPWHTQPVVVCVFAFCLCATDQQWNNIK